MHILRSQKCSSKQEKLHDVSWYAKSLAACPSTLERLGEGVWFIVQAYRGSCIEHLRYLLRHALAVTTPHSSLAKAEDQATKDIMISIIHPALAPKVQERMIPPMPLDEKSEFRSGRDAARRL